MKMTAAPFNAAKAAGQFVTGNRDGALRSAAKAARGYQQNNELASKLGGYLPGPGQAIAAASAVAAPAFGKLADHLEEKVGQVPE